MCWIRCFHGKHIRLTFHLQLIDQPPGTTGCEGCVCLLHGHSTATRNVFSSSPVDLYNINGLLDQL